MVNHQSSGLDTVFAALADPTRRAMLERLARGASTPGALAEPFAVSLPAISRHLRVLERAGLIARRRMGRHHRVTLHPAPMDAAAAWIATHRAFWERQLDALERYLDRTDLNPEDSPWQPKPRSRPSRSASRGASRTRPKRSSMRGRHGRR
jgi:DNA-binding transcriptional ArsR family regulator